jgi:hypothetical protein
MMTIKTHVVIGEHSGPVIDKSNSGSVIGSLARQDGISRLAEYIFETSALADELASNEPSNNKPHAADEPLVTVAAKLDPNDPYSILYDRIKDGCAAFVITRQASCASRSELRRLQRLIK